MDVILASGLAVAVAAGVRGMWSPCGLSMITAINPMAERARGHRYPVTVAWFVAGSVAGSLLLAVPAAALAAIVPRSPALSAAAAAVALLADTRLIRLPEHPRQVDETWLGKYRRWLYAAGFGAQIGAGFATYIMTAANYLVLALAVLSGSPAKACAITLLFGLVRGLGILAAARVRTTADLVRAHRLLDRHAAASLAAVATVEAAVLAVLAGPWAPAAAAVALAVLVSRRRAMITACGVPPYGPDPHEPAHPAVNLTVGAQSSGARR